VELYVLQKIHPAMYEDHVALGGGATGKSGCSENTLAGSHDKAAEKSPHQKTSETLGALTEKAIGNAGQVSVGPRFQAEIPECTGVVSESDSKWLGTRSWSVKHGTEPATETDLGRGRQEKCGCEHPGSVACVRLHIAEKRMKMKFELGSEFFNWGFDRMGEEVSLQWTPEEEKRFKDIMSTKPSENIKYFWANWFRYFPNKTKRQLVSYYFNGYLIQLRTYQNRATPNNIDSDEEGEFGNLSDGFGMEAVKGPDDDIMECSLSEQDINLE